MDDTLRRRLDLVLLLLGANVALLAFHTAQTAPEITVGVLVLVALVWYGTVQSW